MYIIYCVYIYIYIYEQRNFNWGLKNRIDQGFSPHTPLSKALILSRQQLHLRINIQID